MGSDGEAEVSDAVLVRVGCEADWRRVGGHRPQLGARRR